MCLTTTIRQLHLPNSIFTYSLENCNELALDVKRVQRQFHRDIDIQYNFMQMWWICANIMINIYFYAHKMHQ